MFQGHWVAGIQRGQQSGAVLTQQHGGHPRQLPVLQVGFHTPAGSCLLIMESSQCNEDKHVNWHAGLLASLLMTLLCSTLADKMQLLTIAQPTKVKA